MYYELLLKEQFERRVVSASCTVDHIFLKRTRESRTHVLLPRLSHVHVLFPPNMFSSLSRWDSTALCFTHILLYFIGKK